MTSENVARRPVGPMAATLAKARMVPLAEVADHLGIHRNSLAEKLSGRRAFTEDEVVLLAELFGVDPGTMFRDPLELLGVSELRRRSSGRSPSAGSGSSPRKSGCSDRWDVSPLTVIWGEPDSDWERAA